MASNPPKEKADLPRGWIERISKTRPDRTYYFNTMTGASTWVVPCEPDDVPNKIPSHPVGRNTGDSSRTPRVPKVTPQRTPRTDQPDAGEDSTAGGHLPRSSLTRSITTDENVTEGESSVHRSPLEGKSSCKRCRASMGSLGEPSDLSRKRQFLGDVDSTPGRLLIPTSERRARLVSAGHKTGKVQRGEASVVGTLLNRTFPLSDEDRVPPPHAGESTIHRRGSTRTSPGCGQQPKRTKETIDGGPLRKRTKSAELPRERAPRMSVKDMRGWSEYRQERLARRKNYGRQKRSNVEERRGGKVNSDNNDVKNRTKMESRNLLTSFDDVPVEKGQSLKGVNKLVKMTAYVSGARTSWEGAGPSTVRPRSSTSREEPTVSGDVTPNSPVEFPIPTSPKRLLTVFTASELESDRVPAIPSLAGQEPKKKLNIVVDTNVFLSHLTFVEELRDQDIQGFGRPTLVIPWIVLQELDSLKDGKPHDLQDGRIKYKGSLARQARVAVGSINRCLVNKHPRVEGQSIQDCSEKGGGACGRSNDDKILECCLQYKNREEGHDTENVLLTDDINLRNKALVSGVDAFSREGLLKGLTELARNLAKAPPLPRSPKTVTKNPRRKSLSRREDSPKKQQPMTPPRVLTECAITKLVDDLVCNLKNVLRSSLSVVLETEMKAAFDDLWLDIILRKPPWTFMDILDCFDKHWIAVFSQFCSRSTKTNFRNIREFYRDDQGLGGTVESTEELLSDATQLLSDLESHSSYSGALDAPLSQLTKMVVQLKSVRSPSGETSQEMPKPQGGTTSPPAADVRTPRKTQKSAKATPSQVAKATPPKVSTKKILPRKCTLPGRFSPTPTGKGRSLRTLKDVVKEASAEAARRLAEKQADSRERQRRQMVRGQGASKEMKINRKSLQLEPTPPLEVSKTSGEVIDDDSDVAMDTSSEPDCVSGTNLNADDQVPSPSRKLGHEGNLRDVGGFSLTPSPRCSGESSLTMRSPLVTSRAPSVPTKPTNQQPIFEGTPIVDDRVRQVLERAYQELQAACVRVEQSIRLHQSGIASSDHLSLKECCVLIEYLIQYLERSIIAMNQKTWIENLVPGAIGSVWYGRCVLLWHTLVLAVAETNGVMTDTGVTILQGLIGVIDRFFVAMEVSSSGSGLTPAMLGGYLGIPENRECLRLGSYQYQAALEDCRACYQFMAQSVT